MDRVLICHQGVYKTSTAISLEIMLSNQQDTNSTPELSSKIPQNVISRFIDFVSEMLNTPTPVSGHVVRVVVAALAIAGILVPVEGTILTNRDPRDCLVKAVEGKTSQVKFADEPKFYETDVRPYNLNLPYEPFAVTYPKSTKQTAAIVQCAASYGYKVQARSGGHDYTNKGIPTQAP